jgi:hypothetical protein
MRLRLQASTVFALCLFPLLACRAEPDDAAPAPPPRTAAKKAPSQPAPPCDANQDPVLAAPFTDNFERGELGNDWRSTSYGAYFLKSGRLCISKPRNHPLWLRRRLPKNVKVEFEAIPATNNADVKVELFGDGCAFDTDGRDYTATAYVAVLGAHNNSEHWLTRMYEHGADAKKTPLLAGAPSIASSKLIAQTTYRVELARVDGKTVTFKVNDTLIHDFVDNEPLQGPGHDHFGFNGWDAPSCFDKVVVTPLPDTPAPASASASASVSASVAASVAASASAPAGN